MISVFILKTFRAYKCAAPTLANDGNRYTPTSMFQGLKNVLLYFIWYVVLTGGRAPSPFLGALHFAPSETESGQLVKGPASLKIDKLEGLTERIRI